MNFNAGFCMLFVLVLGFLSTVDTAPAEFAPRRCPKCKNIVNCFADPCLQKTCWNPYATCVSDFCEGCHYTFVYKGQKVPGCSSRENSPTIGQASHCDQVYCKKSPCEGKTHRCGSQATCVPDYCSGSCTQYSFWMFGQRL